MNIGKLPVKKLVIKNFKRTMDHRVSVFNFVSVAPQLSEDFESSSWELIQSGLRSIFSNHLDPQPDLEILYLTCENLVRCNFGQSLYNKVYGEYEIHSQAIAGKLERLIANNGDNLVDVIELWTEYKRQTFMVEHALMFLDRCFLLSRQDLHSIHDLSMSMFRTHSLGKPAVLDTLVKNYILSINQARKEMLANTCSSVRLNFDMASELLVLLTELFVETGVFREHVEAALIINTRSVYEAFVKHESRPDNFPNFFDSVSRAFQAENNFNQLLHLPASTRDMLIHAIEEEILIKPIDSILSVGLANTFLSQTSTHQMYLLTSRVNINERVKQSWSEYIKQMGSNIVNDVNRDDHIVEDLLALKAKLDELVVGGFNSDQLFANALKEAFEVIMNGRQNRPGELLAKYLDTILKGSFSFSDGDSKHQPTIDVLLDKVLVLFRFIQGKDVFEAFYKKDLARRLLLGRSISEEVEKSMVARLRAECGSAFTSRMEGMFKDMELSKQLMSNFKEWPRYSEKKMVGKFDFNVSVITSGLWPYPSHTILKLPSSIEKMQDLFIDFYREQNKGRQLAWHQGLGHCVLKANFASGPKELQVSIPQALILLQFNKPDHGTLENEEISFEQLSKATGMDDLTIAKSLQSLIYGKQNLLLCNIPPAKLAKENLSIIGSSARFKYNPDFTSKHYKIKLGSAQLRDLAEEHAATTHEVFEDRQHQVDAAIVRLMKANRRMESKSLVNGVFQACKFPLTVTDLKGRITAMIEREYIKKEESNQDEEYYVYLA